MSKSQFKTIEGHTEGMPVRMVIAGAPKLSGVTMSERREQFIAEYDWIRRALMLEPRGHTHMSGLPAHVRPCHYWLYYLCFGTRLN